MLNGQQLRDRRTREFLRSLTLDELKHLKASLGQKFCLKDFLSFMKDGLGFKVSDHHRKWDVLLANKRLSIQSARDHGKTTFFSVAYPLWKAVTSPGVHICIISYSEPQSKKILQTVKTVVENTPLFHDLMPKRGKPGYWGRGEIHFSNRSTIQAKSFGSSMRGQHYDIVIVDDPLKDRSSIPAEELSNIFFGVITPAVKRDGQIVVVGTPLDFGDLFDILESNKSYVSGKFPAFDSEGSPLWPEQYSKADLDRRKKEIPNYWIFAREYLLQRIDPEKAVFKESWLRLIDKFPPLVNGEQIQLSMLMSVDPAVTVTGDYTGIVVTGTDAGGTTYVAKTRRLRTENVNELVGEIIKIAKTMNVKRMIVEALGFQRLIKYWLYKAMEADGYWLGIEEVKHHRAAKEQRIMSLQPKVEEGRLIFGRWQDDILSEMRSFPKGQHDDLIDALSMQLEYIQTPDRDKTGELQGSYEWWTKQSEVQQSPELSGILWDVPGAIA